VKVNDLPAVAGPRWLRAGWQMYKKAPLAWSLMAGGNIGIFFLLAMIPVIGSIAGAALQPVLVAGIFIAAASVAAHENTPPPNTLFAAFKRPNLRDLVLIGLIESTLTLIVAGVVLQYVLGDIKIAGRLSELDDKTKTALEAAVSAKAWAVFAALAAIAAIKGALWFCVPLLAEHPTMKASHALRWSIYALFSNPAAMLLYGATMLLATFVAALPAALLPPLVMVALLVAVPVVILSNYAGYRAVFDESSPGAAEPPAAG
jgi:uncharacterized membrane protein